MHVLTAPPRDGTVPRSAARSEDGRRHPRDARGGSPARAPGDALGLWAALDEVFPATRHQRCWNHRVLNVLHRLPRRLWPETMRRLGEVWSAPTRVACEYRRDELALWLHAAGQDQAAETLYRGWDDFTTFYDFPAEHWLHLRTSNAIESVFAGVRLRTNVASGLGSARTSSNLVFKIVERLDQHWRVLNGGPTVMTLVLAGERFVDGTLVSKPQREGVKAA